MIKFAHIRDFDSYGIHCVTGGKTIAYTKKEIDGKTRVEYGVAFCSKEDNFCKKTGREYAMNRLTNEPMFLEFKNNKTLDVESLLRTVV